MRPSSAASSRRAPDNPSCHRPGQPHCCLGFLRKGCMLCEMLLLQAVAASRRAMPALVYCLPWRLLRPRTPCAGARRGAERGGHDRHPARHRGALRQLPRRAHLRPRAGRGRRAVCTLHPGASRHTGTTDTACNGSRACLQQKAALAPRLAESAPFGHQPWPLAPPLLHMMLCRARRCMAMRTLPARALGRRGRVLKPAARSQGRFLPDKAIDLVDEACANKRVQLESVPEEIDNMQRQKYRLQVPRQRLCRAVRSEECVSRSSRCCDSHRMTGQPACGHGPAALAQVLSGRQRAARWRRRR